MYSNRKKRTVLSLHDKNNILKRLKIGESATSLSKEYKVAKSTISNIKKSEYDIIQYHEKLTINGQNESKKTMSTAENSVLESAVYLWFSQQRALGTPLSGPIICEKALQLDAKINVHHNFRASNGWLRNFKKRYGIRLLNIQGERLSADSEAAKEFTKTLKDIIKEENYSEDFIYNADETGLYWKSFPKKTLALSTEKSAPGYKVNKQRVTLMICSNATGLHKVPLTMIGKYKNPRCFKHVTNLPISYRAQKNGWMDANVFEEWYLYDFLPSVQNYQKKIGKTGKVLLLLDNAPSHTSKSLANLSNENCRVIMLPPNVTSLLQPMDQGVIEKVKRLYRKNLLKRMLLEDINEQSILSFLKDFTLKDCCYLINQAWECITESNVYRAWRKIMCNVEPINMLNEEATNENSEITELHEIATSLSCYNGDIKDTIEWLKSDEDEQGFEILNDDEIISKVTQNKSREKIHHEEENEENEEVHHDEENEENEEVHHDEENKENEEIHHEEKNEENGKTNCDNILIPKHIEAHFALNTAIKWFKIQPELNMNDLKCLQKLKKLAFIKSSTEHN